MGGFWSSGCSEALVNLLESEFCGSVSISEPGEALELPGKAICDTGRDEICGKGLLDGFSPVGLNCG
jgi:hypothetical protein